jgi:antitoxin HicB
MRCVYPADIEGDKGRLLLSFPDVPEAHTEARTLRQLSPRARDCLVAALGGYVALSRPIPKPSAAKRGQQKVALPALIAAKLALYQAMRGAKVSNVNLAKRLGLSEGAVRRLLDLDHRSHIDSVERALNALGKNLLVEVRRAA